MAKMAMFPSPTKPCIDTKSKLDLWEGGGVSRKGQGWQTKYKDESP